MNPYTIIAALVLAAGLWFGGDHVGHKRGVNEQKVADQAKFDKIDADLTEQKAVANAAYRKFFENNLALVVQRDQFKADLEKTREENRRSTDDLRDRYAGIGLRYAAPPNTGYRGGGRSAGSADPGADRSAAPAVLQLPDALAADLRRLAFDADTLADDYRKCYAGNVGAAAVGSSARTD